MSNTNCRENKETNTVLRINGWNKEGLKEFCRKYNDVLESRNLYGKLFDNQFMEYKAKQAESQPKKRQRVTKEYVEEMPNDLGTAVMPV